MWIPLRTEVLDRFTEVESFFRTTRGLGTAFQQTAKGLAFVHMYAAYEFTARAIVRTAIDSIISHQHRPEDLLPSLMALFLDSELTSFKDSPRTTAWKARIKIFESLFSGAHASVANTIFPTDGSHFRHSQLQTIFDVLGIRRTPAQRRRHLLRIDEVVAHRNAIAHGGETAASVGSRYTRGEVLDRIRQLKSVCLLLLTTVERQCCDTRRHCRRKRIHSPV